MRDNMLIRIFEQILQEIDERKQEDSPFIVGITGIDASGKSEFTRSLAGFLESRGRSVQVVNLDDFHNPREVRYSGEDQAENYFNRSFDIPTVVEKLLVPLRQNSGYSVSLTLLDLNTDRYEVEKLFSFAGGSIVLFEGVFLFRKEFAPYIDYKIFLEVPFDECKKRAAARDSAASLRKYDDKYFTAQRKYLEDYPPPRTADMIIDNTDWQYPKLKYRREIGGM